MSLQGVEFGQQKPGAGIITSSTPTAKGPRIPFKEGLAKPSEFTISSEKQIIEQYRKMSPALRRSLSQRLKDSGYRTPVTGKYNADVRQALLDAYNDLGAEITYLRANDPAALETATYDLDTFLTSQSEGRGGYKGPTTVRQKVNMRPEAIASTIDEVIRDFTGRGATADEIAKYSAKVTAQLEKPKNFAETVYTPKGEGMQMQEITPGFQAKEYLFQQIAKTDEAKANKVFGFYNAFKRALGVE
jgi:hypothetical protein